MIIVESVAFIVLFITFMVIILATGGFVLSLVDID